MNLVYKHERNLFAIAVLISALFWLLLTLVTLGLLLVFAAFGYLLFLFAHSAFISHLKGSGVRITEQQYPDLYRRLVACCDKVGVANRPEAYLLRTDFFNALATRFLGRNFVVLFTDVVDALQDRPGAINFYIGHELGHIHRQHLLWGPLLLPAMLLPVLGTALRRAEEYTCDRYGTACCENDDDVIAALAAIAAGDTHWKDINVPAYLQQVETTGGFWMSFNELIGDYPWLSKRMATALAMRRGEDITHPRRHWFAWFLSLFIPNLGGGGMSLLIVIASIGILAAIAVPAYQDYVARAGIASAYYSGAALQSEVVDYAAENDRWPAGFQELGYEQDVIAGEGYEIGLYDGGVIGVDVGADETGERKYVVLEPQVGEDGRVTWLCYGQNLREQRLPPQCR